MITKSLIVLAGGLSSRMKSKRGDDQTNINDIREAEKKDKGVIGVGPAGRPLLDYLLWNARQAGFEEVVLVTRSENSGIKAHYGKADHNNDFHGLDISYAIQHIPEDRVKPFGTSDALLQAMDQYPGFMDKSFVVCNSDNLYSAKALEQIRKFQSRNAWVDYNRDKLGFAPERIAGFAVTSIDADNYLLDIIEKPNSEQVASVSDAHGRVGVSMNLWKLSGPQIYSFLKDCPVSLERDEKELPQAILAMARSNAKSVQALKMEEVVPDLTEKKDIARVREFLFKEYGEALCW